LPDQKTGTRTLHLRGWRDDADLQDPLSVYGSDAPAIRTLALSEPVGNERLHSRLPYLKAEVVWAARHEMARTVEDVLARRTRALLLDAKASIESAPIVADLLAAELGRGHEWAQRQVVEFTELANGYVPEWIGRHSTQPGGERPPRAR
jgi:glycerol-3-phosphate dehydrogenase